MPLRLPSSSCSGRPPVFKRDMRIIPVTIQNFLASVPCKVDDADFEAVSASRWLRDSHGYPVKAGTRELMHRVLMGMVKGDGRLVDHVDGNPMNNQRGNLRECSPHQNSVNRGKVKRKTSSRFKGVFWRTQTKKWVVFIRSQGKLLCNRPFETELEAAIAYNQEAKKHFGEFARLNVIE